MSFRCCDINDICGCSCEQAVADYTPILLSVAVSCQQESVMSSRDDTTSRLAWKNHDTMTTICCRDIGSGSAKNDLSHRGPFSLRKPRGLVPCLHATAIHTAAVPNMQ